MSLEPAFLQLMPATVQVTPFLKMSTNGYGAPTYSTEASTYQARVTFARRMDFVAEGQSVTPTHVAWLATTQNFDPRSKFSYLGTTYRILNVQRQMDDQTVHHIKLTLLGG